MHLRRERPVELSETARPKPLHLAQSPRGIGQQTLDIDPLAGGRKWREIGRTARQHVDRAMVVEPPEMMEGDADLQDALVQVAHVATLGSPEDLQRFMLLKKFAAIELRNSLEESVRGRLFADRHRGTSVLADV